MTRPGTDSDVPSEPARGHGADGGRAAPPRESAPAMAHGAGLGGVTAPGHGGARAAVAEPAPGASSPVPHALTIIAPRAPRAEREEPLAVQVAQADTISERDSLIAHGPPELLTGRATWSLPDPSLAAALAAPRYQARSELGRGGMGRVMEAVDRRLDRVVAVKESFATDDDGRQRFEREVAITARLEHPSIVPLYDAGITSEGRAFYVMRKVSGRGLDRVMNELPTLDERLGLLPAMLAACDAVAHAHARAVVHRDLKPGNILIGDYGETMVIDWGLAKAIGESDPPGPRSAAGEPRASAPVEPAAPPSSPRAVTGARAGSASAPATAPPLPPDDLHTVAGSVFGTPGFMSPEQARGEAMDMRGDVYALGATLYHLLAGRPPHVGKSATEVMDRVRLEPPPPLVQVCPGAPVELAAIVEKAMAFDIEARYSDASALAGDLRRFLAGQLVAAHRYTFWQRLRRTARTYRAAFLVAGVSLLVVSALAIISVVRIVSERDHARTARQVAVQEAQVAKAARDQASARADELVVAQAHALVAENPTAAMGLLKRLQVTSPVWPRARMVAMAASSEGVARAVPGTGHRPPSIFAMSPHGDRLLVGEDQGRVWVLELERTVVREVVEVGGRPLGCWVNDGASVLLAGGSVGIVVRELGTGRTRSVPFAGSVESVACPARGPVAVLDTEGGLWMLDPVLAQARKVEVGLRGRDVEITRDGAALAVASDREALVLDRDGAIRQRFAGEVIRMIASPEGRIAIMLRDRVVEVAPGAGTFTSAPLPKLAMAIYYLGERLRILLAGNRLVLPDGTVDVDLPSTPAGGAAVGERTGAVGLSDGSVWLSGWWGARLMRTPATGPLIRMAGQPGAARLAGWVRGTVLLWNLGGAIPLRVDTGPAVGRLLFLGEDRLAVSGQQGWYWIDLASGQRRHVEHDELPLFNDVIIDPARGDAMLLDQMLGRAMLARWSQGDIVATWQDRATCATLLGGGAVAIGTSDGRLAVGRPEDGLTLLRMDNAVIGVARLGEHGVLAVDSEGEITAYDLPTATRTQSSLGEPPSGPLVGDGEDGVILALGTRLVRWHKGAVQELAQLAEPVLRLTRYQRHLAIQTPSELLTIDLQQALAPGAKPGATRGAGLARRIAGVSREQQLLDGSRWAIGVGQRGLIELVDIATGVRWNKSIHGGLAMFAVSPSGSRVAQLLGGDIALWTYQVPERAEELRAWLDEQTNATVDDNLDVVWSAPGP